MRNVSLKLVFFSIEITSWHSKTVPNPHEIDFILSDQLIDSNYSCKHLFCCCFDKTNTSRQRLTEKHKCKNLYLFAGCLPCLHLININLIYLAAAICIFTVNLCKTIYKYKYFMRLLFN